jgi:hypothetical protein
MRNVLQLQLAPVLTEPLKPGNAVGAACAGGALNQRG